MSEAYILVLPDGQPYTYTQHTVRMPNGPRVRQIVINDEPSNTQCSAGNDTDINVIMARFDRTGILPPAQVEPRYADVVDLQGDLTEIQQRSHEALEIANRFAESWTKDQEQKAAKAAIPESVLQESTPQS